MTTEDASKWYIEHNRVFTQWSFGLRRFWITSIWQSRLVDVQSTKGPLETKLLQRWSKMTCQTCQKQLWFGADAICIPWKFRCRWILQKKRIRSTLRQSICGSLTSQSPCPLGILAQGNTKQGVTLSFNTVWCVIQGLARQIRFSFRGPMHKAKTVPAVQVRWRIWHPAQVSRKVTNVKEISRTNDCLQFLSPTVPFNCNLLHTQLRCSWFEHFGFKMVQSCLFLFAQRILKKNRIFKCLMANCKSFLCLLTIFVLTQSVLFWPYESPYVPLCFLRWLGEVQNAWVTLR